MECQLRNIIVSVMSKRMGSRMCKHRKEGCYSAAKKKMASLGGKGHLTVAMIDSFQNYYGSAIRRNVGNLEEMRKAVFAIYHHSVPTDAKPQHNYCPKDEISWCKCQQAVARKEAEHFAHKKTIPSDFAKAIHGIFIDLADPKLLERC